MKICLNKYFMYQNHKLQCLKIIKLNTCKNFTTCTIYTKHNQSYRNQESKNQRKQEIVIMNWKTKSIQFQKWWPT
jgi:hypothetical protein